MGKDCPCYGCTERFIACSDRCPKDERGDFGHKAWKAKLEAQKKAAKLRNDLAWSNAKRRAIWATIKGDHHGIQKNF